MRFFFFNRISVITVSDTFWKEDTYFCTASFISKNKICIFKISLCLKSKVVSLIIFWRKFA